MKRKSYCISILHRENMYKDVCTAADGQLNPTSRCPVCRERRANKSPLEWSFILSIDIQGFLGFNYCARLQFQTNLVKCSSWYLWSQMSLWLVVILFSHSGVKCGFLSEIMYSAILLLLNVIILPLLDLEKGTFKPLRPDIYYGWSLRDSPAQIINSGPLLLISEQ